ncbi:unnamed protein product, partial [Iphiclides podalirius]
MSRGCNRRGGAVTAGRAPSGCVGEWRRPVTRPAPRAAGRAQSALGRRTAIAYVRNRPATSSRARNLPVERSPKRSAPSVERPAMLAC